MATFTALPLDAARAIGADFGVDVVRVVGVPAGSVNSNYRLETHAGERFFARVYEEQDAEGAGAEARLLDHLASHGVVTPRPLARRDGAGFVSALAVQGGATKPVAVFPWSEGEMRCQKSVDEGAARAVGEALARVHVAGAEFGERREGRFRVDDVRARLSKVAAAADPELAAMAPRIAGALDRAVELRDASLPKGVIHGDLFRDNVLWAGARPSALLDFESASHGVLAYDLAVTLLAWCFGDDLELGLVRAMIAGYDAVRPLSAAERSGLAAEARVAALRFTTTRITDFAMREGLGARVVKDWRRFWARHERVAALATFG